MELHIDYEKQPEYPLGHIEHPTNPVSFRITRMKLSKDKTSLTYNDFLTLRGIPPATFNYRLGNRSAFDWVIDQYRITTDTRSGITNDPTEKTTPSTSFASSARSSPSRLRPRKSSPACPRSACPLELQRRAKA